MQKLQFPQLNQPYFVTIRDRARNSGLTSVRWIDRARLLCCDFNEKTAYLVGRKGSSFQMIHVLPTTLANGQPAQTDLMDYRNGRMAVTNFFQGSVSLYRVANDRISFWKELNLSGFKGVHGVRFLPGHDDLIWVSYCGKANKCLQIIDIEQERVLWTVPTEEQAQDVAFLGPYAMMFARTPHITEGVLENPRPEALKTIYATVYLFRMPSDIRCSPPVLVDTWRGEGHLDAAKEFGGLVFGANQYLDRVDVFGVDDGKVRLKGSLSGFQMPHGLDINDAGELAVTNYGDQSLRIARLREARIKRAAGASMPA
ncbi:MAG: hypothetical protein RIS35_3382 [Pseudomonadota bacterium]|jgi:hypothetical protein